MEDMIQKQLDHRTIRAWKDKEVPNEDLEVFKEVIQRTATSTGMQTYSVIRVIDEEKRKAISDISTQDYVRTAPELFIFIVDAYRNSKIAKEVEGEDFREASDMERFFQGFTDACLAAQNLTNAIEAKDMGAVFLGSVLNDIPKLIDVLELPELTFPVLGVAFGYPDQEPMLKPRMDMRLRFFEDSYKKFDDYLDEIKEYDQEMQTYYDLRQANKPLDSFSAQIVDRYKNTLPKRTMLINYMKDQGFDLKLNEDIK